MEKELRELFRFVFLDCPGLQKDLVHKTFLEELVFWTVKYEFPQKVVCFLLNMLPDAIYKVLKLFFLFFFYFLLIYIIEQIEINSIFSPHSKN